MHCFSFFLRAGVLTEYSSHNPIRLTTLVDHPSRLEKTGESHSSTIGNFSPGVKKGFEPVGARQKIPANREDLGRNLLDNVSQVVDRDDDRKDQEGNTEANNHENDWFS